MRNFNIKKVPKYMLAAVMVYLSVLIFIENFVFSSRFTTLSLRDIDEAAFQLSLYKYHSCTGSDFWVMNDYGYGWVYWFLIGLITYPAHLLFEATGISWLLIVLPRVYSLFLCMMCSVLCYKIVSVYTENEWLKMAIVFMMPLFPSGADWAGRFSTVPQVAFFAMLSVWLVVKNDELDRKKLRRALWAFACAMATKVSAVVVAPLLILLVLARYRWQFKWDNIKIWIQEALMAGVLMVFLTSPIVVLAPLDTGKARLSIDVLVSYWTKNQGGGVQNWLLNLKQLLMFTVSKNMVIVLCMCLLLLAINGIWNLKLNKADKSHVIYWDYVCFPMGYFIGMLYLCLTIGTGVKYLFMYATAVSFVMPMGLLIFDRFKIEKVKEIAIIFISIMLCFCQINIIHDRIESQSRYNILNYFQRGANLKKDVENINDMEEIIRELGMEEINYFADHWAPNMVWNSLEHDNVISSCTVWDNLGSLTDSRVNLLILSKQSIGFYDDSEFEDAVALETEEKQQEMRSDREARNILVNTGEFLGYTWKLVYENETDMVYQRVD